MESMLLALVDVRYSENVYFTHGNHGLGISVFVKDSVGGVIPWLEQPGKNRKIVAFLVDPSAERDHQTDQLRDIMKNTKEDENKPPVFLYTGFSEDYISKQYRIFRGIHYDRRIDPDEPQVLEDKLMEILVEQGL
ncbi:MAG: hypothetical protein IH934_07720 [Nanoarchaeota archaeon]|nr:hypothetical protein [Nanoarchaeota archaeon]